MRHRAAPTAAPQRGATVRAIGDAESLAREGLASRGAWCDRLAFGVVSAHAQCDGGWAEGWLARKPAKGRV